ncbi:hypothetical protein [Methylorubrum aminovorans]|uniref:hypothetical protein n=1 Tax=Methylorubrum aminovorans TaxID=269069 RepID=UPI0024E16C48|nr:hypothetical protein [Methylorubrum aminovorans]
MPDAAGTSPLIVPSPRLFFGLGGRFLRRLDRDHHPRQRQPGAGPHRDEAGQRAREQREQVGAQPRRDGHHRSADPHRVAEHEHRQAQAAELGLDARALTNQPGHDPRRSVEAERHHQRERRPPVLRRVPPREDEGEREGQNGAECRSHRARRAISPRACHGSLEFSSVRRVRHVVSGLRPP